MYRNILASLSFTKHASCIDKLSVNRIIKLTHACIYSRVKMHMKQFTTVITYSGFSTHETTCVLRDQCSALVNIPIYMSYKTYLHMCKIAIATALCSVILLYSCRQNFTMTRLCMEVKLLSANPVHHALTER